MKIGICGVTGAVGLTLLQLLEQRGEAAWQVLCFASARSAGGQLPYRGGMIDIQLFDVEQAKTCDVVFLCVSGSFSQQYAQLLAQHCIVIDNSSAFRYHDEVPLLVPDVNGHRYQGERLIANPNCSSAIALEVLAPIEQAYGIDCMIVSTYQAASGAGLQGMEELKQHTQNFSQYDPQLRSEYFNYALAYNVVPQVDAFQANGYTKEEMKVVWEVQKVLARPDLKISTTAVRVPTLRSHAESITLKLQQPLDSVERVRQLLAQAPGVVVYDDIDNRIYPMPSVSTGQDAVYVGRLRRNLVFEQYGLDLFVSGDQLLRGAALNAYEIMLLTQQH